MPIDSRKAKEEILMRIRRSTTQPAPAIAPPGINLKAEWGRIRRDFQRRGALTAEQRLQLFEDRLRDYGAGVHRTTLDSLPEVAAEILRSRGKHTMLAPPGLPEAWLPAGVAVLRDDQLSYAALDAAEGAITGCTLGIALTGTIVLQGGPHEGRRALTLVPDYHLCLVRAEQVVELVPEAMEKLLNTGDRPTTLISGPSATSDIEMKRIQGVHGPRAFDVILLVARPAG